MDQAERDILQIITYYWNYQYMPNNDFYLAINLLMDGHNPLRHPQIMKATKEAYYRSPQSYYPGHKQRHLLSNDTCPQWVQDCINSRVCSHLFVEVKA